MLPFASVVIKKKKKHHNASLPNELFGITSVLVEEEPYEKPTTLIRFNGI